MAIENLTLKKMNDETLIIETEKLVKHEREVLSRVLQHLREIERRRLFAKLKFTSLFDYAVKRLGYSEDQAYRRIQAMRLLRDLPELEEKINEGTLNLTHIGLAQSFLRREEKSFKKSFSKEQKIQILENLENKTKRDAEKFVVSISSEATPAFKEVTKVLTKDLNEIRLAVGDDVLEKITKLKGLLAHKNPNMTTAELLEQLCDLGLREFSPAPARDVKRKHEGGQSKTSLAETRRQVWAKAKGSCQNCGSKYALEVDHRLPKALGGDLTFENLRLLCRTCNQRAAISVFGAEKMEAYLNSPI